MQKQTFNFIPLKRRHFKTSKVNSLRCVKLDSTRDMMRLHQIYDSLWANLEKSSKKKT